MANLASNFAIFILFCGLFDKIAEQSFYIQIKAVLNLSDQRIKPCLCVFIYQKKYIIIPFVSFYQLECIHLTQAGPFNLMRYEHSRYNFNVILGIVYLIKILISSNLVISPCDRRNKWILKSVLKA